MRAYVDLLYLKAHILFDYIHRMFNLKCTRLLHSAECIFVGQYLCEFNFKKHALSVSV